MVSSFNSNNVFETELTAGWEFNYDDNIILISDFILNNITNKYEYNFELNYFNALQNIDIISNIDYTLHSTTNISIDLKFSYSLDNNIFTSYMIINDTNLELIKDVKFLWIKVSVTLITETQPLENINLPISTIYISGTRYLDSIFDAETLLPGDLKVFTAQDTYKVFTTTSYKVFLKTGNESDLDIYFRYTQNQGRNWTEWLRLTDANLQRQQYIKVKFCDFQFGFRNKSTIPIKLYDLELIGDFQNVTGNYKLLNRFGLKTQCNPIVNEDGPCSCDDEIDNSNCSPCSMGFTPWNNNLSNNCNFSNITNINDVKLMGGIIETQQILNEYVEGKNNWPFEYFYTDPDKQGIDTILNENQLTNVIMKRVMKVMVPDNQFPTDQITFSGFGMDLILTFEVHILKSTFKKMFGVEARPRKNDYMYLCNTNLIYEVEQVLDKKDVMNASFYWRVILKKYEEKASRKFSKTQDGQEAKTFTDGIVKYTTLDNLFSDQNALERSEKNLELHNHTDNISKSQQATDLAKGNYTLYKSFNKKLKRENEEIWNASTLLSDVQYKISMKTKNDKMIIYDDYYKDNIVDNINNRAFSTWFKTEEYNPLYDHTLLSNYDYTNNLGYKINLFDGALSITINNHTYSAPVNIENNVWYAFYIGMNQAKEEIEISIYKRQSEMGRSLSNNKLLKIAGINTKLNLFTFNHNEEIFIGGVDIFNINNNKNSYYLTNIVLWKEPISKAKRSAVLNQKKYTDGHLILLVDDANEPLTMPFYGNI